MTAWETIKAEPEPLTVRVEKFLRLLAPRDLAGRPLYVVLRSEVNDARFDAVGPCRAYTADALDLYLRPTLAAAGRWQGRGPAMLMYDDLLSLSDGESHFLQVAIHELAHILEQPMPRLATTEPETWPDYCHPMADLNVAAAAWSQPATCNQPQWHKHGIEFIRAALHLFCRAQWYGFMTDGAAAGPAGPHYGLSPAGDYLLALGREVFDYADRKIADLANMPAPEVFQQLWKNDIAAARSAVRSK